MFIIFNIIYILIFPFFALHMAFKGKWHDGMTFRLGNIPESFRRQLSDKPKIWIHAVSAGEVLAVVEFIKRLSVQYPDHQVICSTVTRTGFELAQANLKNTALVMYAPIDFSWVAKKFVDAIRPNIYISAETELWPNLYRCLSERQVPIVLINGRISDKSFKNYGLAKFLIQPALRAVRVFAMQTEEDARRIIMLGADPLKVQTVGNLKFDTVNFSAVDHSYDSWSRERIFLAGSTHPGEEEIVLDAFERLRVQWPDFRLMIVPRHIERADSVIRLLKERNLQALKLSGVKGDWPENSVIVVDEMGKLRHLYKISSAVFIGKTFKAGGGQNMIEPLAFGKPTFVGPLTQNFKDVVNIFLRAGVLFCVQRPEQLAETMTNVLNDASALERIRIDASDVIRSHQGSTGKLMEIMRAFL